jgi:diguanylate cyclase (GGDEF)-like protein/PAS domain S-box-containing protein
MRPRTVQEILKALGRREGECVLAVCDPRSEAAGRDFAARCAELGVPASLLSAPSGSEPGAPVVAALRGAPIAVFFGAAPLDASPALRQACAGGGLRAALLGGLDAAALDAAFETAVPELADRVQRLAALLEGARELRLLTSAGTDLRIRLEGRPLHRDLGDLSAPGSLGRLPAGTLRVAPLEGSAEGALAVDASSAGLDRGAASPRLRFSAGRLAEIPDHVLRDALQRLGPDAAALGEIALDVHPRSPSGGAVRVSLGFNAASGGRLEAPVRVDLLLRGVRLEVDGRPVDPALFASAAAAADPLPPDVVSPETFRILFENANDPQYVLDLDTQRFLEVNPAFERLTGWRREELLAPDFGGAAKLVARESLPTYQQKRETRRMNAAERYDLKLVLQNGEKRPVELSVRRLVLGGRDVVFGTVRDLAHRKKLEQEMWEKIEELGYANSRIYALTEKIKRVPELTPQLLHITNEEELLERTAQLLCAREGLGYADVNFYLLKEDALELAYSTVKTKKRSVKLSPQHHLVRVLLGEVPGGMTNREAVLPLKGRERNLGVMEVYFHPKEIEVLQDNERALKGYRDLLETLSNVIGLLVENLHLYDRVRRQSIVDHLTGVYNRRYFDQKLADEFNRAARYGRAFALVLIDVDKFKEINDKMSYKQGDQVLVETSRLFRNQTREVDMVCRYGGDEFAVLMPETTYEGALAKAEQIRQVVRNAEFTNTQDPAVPLHLTLSIGVTSWIPEFKTPDDLLRAVDEAVHLAKRSGRDCVCGKFKGLPKPAPRA